MNQRSKLTELVNYLIPVSSDGSSLARQGLQRLLQLRTFVTLTGVVGLFIFQFFSSLEIPVQFIAYLICAVLLSVLLGYWPPLVVVQQSVGTDSSSGSIGTASGGAVSGKGSPPAEA